MPTLTSVRYGNEVIPVGPLCVTPENQEEVTEEDQPIKHVMKCEMNTEIDQENLPLEDRYGATPQANLIKGDPGPVVAQQRLWFPGSHQRVPVEVHNQGHGTLFVELNLSEETELFRLVGRLSESKSKLHQNRFCQLVGLWSDEKIDIAVGPQAFLRVECFRERLTLQEDKRKVTICESRCNFSQGLLMVHRGGDRCPSARFPLRANSGRYPGEARVPEAIAEKRLKPMMPSQPQEEIPIERGGETPEHRGNYRQGGSH